MNGSFIIHVWDYSFVQHSAAHRHLVSNVCITILFIFLIISNFKYLGLNLCHDYCFGLACMFLNSFKEYFSKLASSDCFKINESSDTMENW